MARIRTIKPEFFSSHDICSLTPLARLFYVSLWCESDREGRLVWNIKTLKIRYFPTDRCNIEDLAQELISAGLIMLYEHESRVFAYIPSFKTHQVINNRESESTLPEPNFDAAFTRADACQGKEGRKEGKERKGSRVSASRIQPDLTLSDEWIDTALELRKDWNRSFVHSVFDTFKDYWMAKAGKDAVKADWLATWRGWCKRDNATPKQQSDIFRGNEI